MTWSLWVTSGILGWGIVLLSTPFVLKSCGRLSRCRAADLHHSPRSHVSRLGGLGLAAAYFGIECLMFFAGDEEADMNSFLVNSAPLAMFAVGFWDDLKRLRAITKLAWQLLIALAVSLSGVGIQFLELPAFMGISEQAWEAILTTLWLVMCTNAINLVDGVDGLAGSIGLILLGLMVCLSPGGQAYLAAGMAGALLAFLWFNLSPARIYLGDGGAYFIGFQVGLFSILASKPRSDLGPLILVLLGLTLPLMDAALALIRRGLRGLPLFRPDRNHLHHYLLATGMAPRHLVIWYSGITLGLLALGWLVTFGPRTFLLPLLLVVGLVLAMGSRRLMLRLGGWKTLKRALSSSVAMRQEVAYALCLRSWLKHEAERCASVEELFTDLRLAAGRLGFTSVQLALADGTRGWKRRSTCGPLLATRHSLQGGTLGVLELEAPHCRLSFLDAPRRLGSEKRCGPSCRPVSNDAGLIRILSELLAESWVEATQDWNPGKAHLRFDHELPRVWGIARRGVLASPVEMRDFEASQERPLVTRTPGFLRRAFGFAVGGLLLGATMGTSGECPASAALQESFAEISRVELPAKAAHLVLSAKLGERSEMTRTVVQAAGRVSVAVVPAVVGAISKTTLEMAALAAGEAAREQPAQACAIATAAAAGAPAQTRAIVLAVCRAVPGDSGKVALSVEHALPNPGSQFREAPAERVPGIRNASLTNSEPVWASPFKATVPAPGIARSFSEPEHVRRGYRTASRDPVARGPTIGPPFVPLSGTVTNIKPSTSGTVPTGGRNYARP
jgi:UDP-GlcNAc:undecaprenyl-phosphate GlcNAc-1-phosphate transferase